VNLGILDLASLGLGRKGTLDHEKRLVMPRNYE